MANQEQPAQPIPAAPPPPDAPPERTVNIQGTVKIDTASGETSATAIRIGELRAGEVNIQNPPAPPLPLRVIALTAILALLEGALVNIATGQLPASWAAYLWLAWPLLALVTAAGVLMAYRQSRRAASQANFWTNRRNHRRTKLGTILRIGRFGISPQSYTQPGYPSISKKFSVSRSCHWAIS